MDGDYRLLFICENQDLQDYEDLQDWDDTGASFYGYCLEASMTRPG